MSLFQYRLFRRYSHNEWFVNVNRQSNRIIALGDKAKAHWENSRSADKKVRLLKEGGLVEREGNKRNLAPKPGSS